MMYSFKQYLFEMARSAEGKFSKIPVWDEDDKRYFKYIYDNAPESIKNDRDQMVLLFRRAIFLRYGRGEEGGILKKPQMFDKNSIDHVFNLKGREVSYKNIPMNMPGLVSKIKERGWNPEHPAFGYGRSNWMPLGQRASSLINYFENGDELAEKDKYYTPKFNAGQDEDETGEKETTYRLAKEKGVKKSKDFEEFQQKSMKQLQFDDADKEYLSSVKHEFEKEMNDKIGAGSQLSPGENWQDSWTDVAAAAIGMRYSNRWIKQEGDKFVVKDIYTDNSEPDGFMWGNLEIPRKGKSTIRLKDIKLNLPHLAKRLETLAKSHSRNFVKDPILTSNMLGREKAQGLQTAKRWVTNGVYVPHHGTKGTETIFDQDFYEQIKQDWDAWRKRGENAFAIGKPVSPEMQEKLPWRTENKIIEPPNISDTFDRNAEQMSWDKLMEDDAKRGVNAAITYLSSKRNDPNFSEKMRNPNNYETILQAAKYELMLNKTGVDHEAYRSEGQRIRWVQNAALRSINELLKQQAAGSTGLEDKSGVEDRAVDYGANDTVNTGKTNHRIEDEDDKTYHPSSDDEKPYQKPSVPQSSPADWNDYMKELGRQNKLIPKKPANINLRVWLNMSDDAKFAAMKQAGMVSPEA